MSPPKTVVPSHLHKGEPRGQMRSIDGVQTYYTLPESGSLEFAVLIFTDAMGHNYLYNKLLADCFAENGYMAVMPDLFAGDAMPMKKPPNFDRHAWYSSHLASSILPIARKVITHMKTTGVKLICGAGYCVGAKYVTHFLANGGDLVAGFIAHGVFLDTDDVLGIKSPLSVALGGSDTSCDARKRDELSQLLKTAKVAHQINLYSWAPHGFAIIADPSDRQAVFVKEQAFLQAIHWFNFYTRRGVSPIGWD